MCGIAGIVKWRGEESPSTDRLRSMAAALRHRGPDEFGIYRDRRAGLAHARLSIIDLLTGRQPMCNEDRELWIVFNGEIFNYIELREQLIGLGHRFRTKSDTEVILHAYEEWDEAAFERFNGQFAVALWDTRREKLTLARDRFGIHPLYVCEHESATSFASEVKAIFASDHSIPRAFDPAGLEETFTFWSTVAPRTVFQGIVEVPPGYIWVRTAHGLRKHRFTKPHYPRQGQGEFTGSIGEASTAVREALGRAARLRILRADVPVGCYLSGGLDSSLIAALCYGVKGEKLRTFSLRFQDAEYDETEFQRRMANHLGSEHHEVLVTHREIAEAFPRVVFHAERPILRTAPAPLLLLSRLVREAGVKVVLTGEGADEMFAGYDIFREAKVRRFWGRQPESTWRPRLLERLYPYLARSPVAQRAMAERFFGQDLEGWNRPGFSHGPRWRSTAALKRLFTPEVREANDRRDIAGELLASLPSEFSGWSFLAQDQYLEVQTLLSSYLLSSQGDRMLMASSIEGRYPFLDPEVAALADSLPPTYKLHVLDEKHVLKRAAERLLPEAILRRKKQPYRAPDARSFLAPAARVWVEEMLSEAALRKAGVFDPVPVTRLWRKCRKQPAEEPFSNADNMALVGVLSTQILHHLLIERPPIESASIQPETLVDRVGT